MYISTYISTHRRGGGRRRYTDTWLLRHVGTTQVDTGIRSRSFCLHVTRGLASLRHINRSSIRDFGAKLVSMIKPKILMPTSLFGFIAFHHPFLPPYGMCMTLQWTMGLEPTTCAMDTPIAQKEAAPRARSFSRVCTHCAKIWLQGWRHDKYFCVASITTFDWRRSTANLMRFQNKTISDKTRREFEHYWLCVTWTIGSFV